MSLCLSIVLPADLRSSRGELVFFCQSGKIEDLGFFDKAELAKKRENDSITTI